VTLKFIIFHQIMIVDWFLYVT